MLGACAPLGHSAGEAAASFPEFKPGTARDYLNAVVQLVQEQSVLAGQGMTADACFTQARIRSQLGQKEDAERWARRALETDPARVEIRSFLADVLIHQDRLDEAARCLRQALDLKPDLPGAQRALGTVLDRLGDRKGAREAFEIAIQQAPKDATARLLLGRLLLDLGDGREAALSLQRACQLDPKLAGAFYALSQAQRQLGDSDAAQQSLRTFQELRQQEKADLDARNAAYDDERFMRALAAGFHVEAAGLLWRQNEPALAEAHLRQAVTLTPKDPHAYEVLATLLRQTGRLEDARGIYETLVSLRPEQAACRVNLGTLLLELKDHAGASEAFKRALDLDPNQPQALGSLARIYLTAKRELPEALRLSRRLVDIRPAAASYDLLGWACYANGQTNEARAAAAQAVEREPTNTVYRTRYRQLQALQ